MEAFDGVEIRRAEPGKGSQPYSTIRMTFSCPQAQKRVFIAVYLLYSSASHGYAAFITYGAEGGEQARTNWGSLS